MATQNAAALRAARQQRLAQRQSAGAAGGTQSNSKSNDEVRQASTPASAPAAGATPATISSAVTDPSMVSKTANIDLLLYGEGTENPHWVVLAGGRPVAEIRLEDQEEPAKVARYFVTEGYAKGVREAAKSFDFAEVLSGVRARSYLASVQGNDAVKRIEAAAKDAAKAELKKAKAALRDDALNMLNLVVVAQTKNFISDNVLKSELFSRMKEAGINDRQAVAIIEAAYQAKAPEHFENCFKQAFKWMDLQPEALSELEEQIKGLAHRTPHVAESEEIPSARFASSQITNIPLETRSASFSSNEGDEKDSLREKLGFGRRNR